MPHSKGEREAARIGEEAGTSSEQAEDLPMNHSDCRAVIGLLAAAVVCGPSAAQAREERLLSGAWEYQKVAELEYPPPGNWQPVQVPGYLSGTNYERAWFRRTFEAPDTGQAGTRYILRFLGVKYNSTVYVNGQKVGGHFGGHEMFELDISDAVKVGQPNELLVGLHDWTGLFSERVDLVGDWDQLRDAPKDAILAPIGGVYNLYGIWDDVYLLAVPGLYVSDVTVRPSVREKQLTAVVEVHNASGEGSASRVTAVVLDGEREVLPLREQSLNVAAGGTASVTLSASAEALQMWWPEAPKLYTLRVELGNGDQVDTRFGYRELWTEGQWFVLNGQRIILRGSGGDAGVRGGDHPGHQGGQHHLLPHAHPAVAAPLVRGRR
jgi:beta-galactosidase/beta-glucuronidase